MKQPVSVHILTGFLGSGKTTLLTRALDYFKLNGKKPAVLMNELGDVNLDGMMVDEEVPMTEMLGGCICCTIRGDLGMELKQLIQDHKPDVVFVESTGAANPMEMLDGITDASMLTEVALQSVITVVDAAQLAERSINPAGRTYRLMADQIRCATRVILNKTDLIPPSELLRLEAVIRELNPVAPIIPTVRCEMDLTVLDHPDGGVKDRYKETQACRCEEDHGHDRHDTVCGHEGLRLTITATTMSWYIPIILPGRLTANALRSLSAGCRATFIGAKGFYGLPIRPVHSCFNMRTARWILSKSRQKKTFRTLPCSLASISTKPLWQSS